MEEIEEKSYEKLVEDLMNMCRDQLHHDTSSLNLKYETIVNNIRAIVRKDLTEVMYYKINLENKWNSSCRSEHIFKPDYTLFVKLLNKYNQNSATTSINTSNSLSLNKWTHCVDEWKVWLLNKLLSTISDEIEIECVFMPNYATRKYMKSIHKEKTREFVRKMRFYSKKFFVKIITEFRNDITSDLDKIEAGIILPTCYNCLPLSDLCSYVVRSNLSNVYKTIFYNSVYRAGETLDTVWEIKRKISLWHDLYLKEYGAEQLVEKLVQELSCIC